MDEVQALAGGSLPHLCFVLTISSPLCNHTPVQRKAILDNCDLNPDLAVSVFKVSLVSMTSAAGVAVQYVSALCQPNIRAGAGQPAPASCTGSLCGGVK